jgi:hypothetical protein
MKNAPRARFELATLRLTADRARNLSAASDVAYNIVGAIPIGSAGNPVGMAGKEAADESDLIDDEKTEAKADEARGDAKVVS